MSSMVEMAGSVETGIEALQELRDFAWVQTTNVLNSGRQVLDWYLAKAAESPLLARLTQAVAEASSRLKPSLAASDKDAGIVGLSALVGLLGGVALGAGMGIYRERHSKESHPSENVFYIYSGGLIGFSGGIIFGLSR